MKKNSGYRISTVSKLTGISSETLRIWEHRYSIVRPERSASGVRIYNDKDIQHLSLLKQLIAHGDSIGNLAELSFSQLEQRLKNFTNIEQSKLPGNNGRSFSSVCVLGTTLPLLLKKYYEQQDLIKFTGLYTDDSEFESKVHDESPDLLIMEYPTILDDDVSQIKQRYRHSNANQLLVVYGFSNSTTLKKLDHKDIILFQGPIDFYQILNICNIPVPADRDSEDSNTRFFSPRRFTDQQLSKLSMMETSVKCECP
ncbi:MAG: MerR family transcriptional regulator, partial [Gammaproteobacteria bacterium]|nr:MerR family transcriptional regulator [Gammaproteobacteria bacterium]